MKQTFFCAMAAAVVLTAGASVAADTPEPLRVACESSFAPFEFYDTKAGKLVGFDIDLIQAVADRLKRPLVIDQMTFDAIIPALLTGSADAGISGITITEERKQKVDFSDPYYLSGLSILIRASDKEKIKTVEDLNNRTLCAQIGTSGAMRAQEVPGAQVKIFNTVNETYLELRNRGCDAVIGDRPVNGYFLAARPKSAKFYHHLPITLSVEEYGVIVRKGNSELVKAINDTLAQMRADGSYDKLHIKWFGEPAAKKAH